MKKMSLNASVAIFAIVIFVNAINAFYQLILNVAVVLYCKNKKKNKIKRKRINKITLVGLMIKDADHTV